MNFRPYGKTGKSISVLGFGSSRFRTEDLKDEDGLHRCAELVKKANSLGVNFFDVAPLYANGHAERIYGIAFKSMPNPFYVSDKSIITSDRTADDVRRRIDQQLETLGVKKIAFYHMWSIMNREHYLRVMAKNGPYEGALKAKNEGLIEHICFSTHANVTENLEIIQNGAFEGMTISFNALNYKALLPVIEAGMSKGIGIAVMNPLCGGMITKQEQFFNYLIQTENETIAAAALRFVSAFPGITTLLSGISEENEIKQNVEALSKDPLENNRIELVQSKSLKLNDKICTGCKYCQGCPVGIPIPEYMQAYNMRLFPNMEYMGRTIQFKNDEQSKANNIFRTLRQNNGIIPEDSKNICIKCGQCESKCTQHLPIMTWLDEISILVSNHGYSKSDLKQRIEEAANNLKSYKLGLYPTGVYTEALYTFIKENFPNLQLYIFDKNSSLWGKDFMGLTIMSPKDIPNHVNTLLISHYLYQDSIYEELKILENEGVKVIKLHKDNDIPYFC
jgi:predicted aldo/keto reductase-like oxidoreductase